MKLKALITAEVLPDILEPLSSSIDFEYAGYHLDHVVMDHDELLARIKDYHILVCEYDTISRDIIEAADNLKIIICCRGGIKTVVDIEAAMERKIIVCNNSGRNANSVSDMTLGYILDLTRNISLTNNLIHNKIITMDESTKPEEYRDTVWGLDNDSPFIKYRGKSINHMTLGLVGFGHAGKLVAQKAKAFGMDIIAYDPYIFGVSDSDLVSFVSFDKLLAKADIISLHCTLTPQTKLMFGAEQFSQMKTGAYFINTARGELIDEDALISALKSNKLAGAALDVTTVEPISEFSPLVNCPNLIITPHIAGSSYDVQVCGTNMVYSSLKTWLEGKKPDNCVVYI